LSTITADSSLIKEADPILLFNI